MSAVFLMNLQAPIGVQEMLVNKGCRVFVVDDYRSRETRKLADNREVLAIPVLRGVVGVRRSIIQKDIESFHDRRLADVILADKCRNVTEVHRDLISVATKIAYTQVVQVS